MPCYHSWPAWQTPDGEIHKTPTRSPMEKELQLPCGTCIGCQNRKHLDLVVRGLCEMKWREANGEDCWFLTLTYRNENLPPSRALVMDHATAFVKQLRNDLRKRPEEKFKYLAAGEYGTRHGRPHYHLILWGLPIEDLKRSNDGHYASTWLEESWGRGFIQLKPLTETGIRYALGYVDPKKPKAQRELERRRPVEKAQLHPEGYVLVPPEQIRKSRLLGIAFLERWWADIYPEGMMQVGTKANSRLKAPDLFNAWMKENQPGIYAEWLARREQHLKELENHPDATDERMAVREEIALARAALPSRWGGLE